MSKTRTTIFSSAVFPGVDDMALWTSLTDAEKHAVIAADEAAGHASGTTPDEPLDARLARVRSSAAAE